MERGLKTAVKANLKTEVDKMHEPLRASSSTKANALAGSLAGVIREDGKAEIHAIGAGAINVTQKAIAIARGFVAPSGMDLVVRPAFMDTTINGRETTGMKFMVEPA